MKKRLRSLIIGSGLMVILAMPSAATADPTTIPELMLIADGKTDYMIVVPDGEDVRNRVKKASDLLQATLAEATGVRLPVVKESERKAGAPAIYLGRTQAAAKAGLPLEKLKEWTFGKRVVGKDVFLAGSDASVNIKDRPDLEYLGTLKAVTSFLEDEIGVRFLLPGPNGLYIPRCPTVKVRAQLDVLQTPNLRFCGGRSVGEIYEIANDQFPFGSFMAYAGSCYYRAVPKEKYAKDHPEYFILSGGVRDPSENHLCISNPEVQKLMLEEIEKQFDLGYDWVEWYQTDGYRGCECKACWALNEDEGERLWIVHCKLAEIIKKRHPGKKLAIKAYGPTRNPPKTFKRLPDNVIIEWFHCTQEGFDQWRRYASEFCVWVYNWSYYHSLGFAPKRTPRFVGEQMRLFIKNKVHGVYKCGFGENLGLEGPVFYVWCKMIRDPDADPYAIADEFYRAAYGQARAPMKAFFDALYNRLELYSLATSSQATYAGRGGQPRPWMPGTPEDAVTYFFPPRLIMFMAEQLQRARELDDDPRVQARLRLVQREFEYLKNLSSVFYSYQTYRLNPNGTTFDILANEIEKRNALIDSWYDPNGRMIVADGWPTFFDNVPKSMLQQGGKLAGILSAPFNWDVKALREKKILPGVDKKKTVVPRLTQPVQLDGNPDKPAWRNIKPEEFGEIGMGVLKEGTLFKAAYDQEAIYLAFTCQLSAAGQVQFTPEGQDGNCWRQEDIEIFLDPFGTRERYFQFIFNPVPNSRWDGRMGFITDPLDPRYGNVDASWNGAWQYAPRVDPEKKQWTAEIRIPFATLGVPAPKPGTIWTGNVGREHYISRDALELSLWSPNLEERSFGAPAAFGTLVFE